MRVELRVIEETRTGKTVSVELHGPNGGVFLHRRHHCVIEEGEREIIDGVMRIGGLLEDELYGRRIMARRLRFIWRETLPRSFKLILFGASFDFASAQF